MLNTTNTTLDLSTDIELDSAKHKYVTRTSSCVPPSLNRIMTTAFDAFIPATNAIIETLPKTEADVAIKLCLHLSLAYANLADADLVAPEENVDAIWQALLLRPHVYAKVCESVYDATRARFLHVHKHWHVKAFPGVVSYDPDLNDNVDTLKLRRRYGVRKTAQHVKLLGAEFSVQQEINTKLRTHRELMGAVHHHLNDEAIVAVYVRDQRGQEPCGHCHASSVPLLLCDGLQHVNNSPKRIKTLIHDGYGIPPSIQDLRTKNGTPVGDDDRIDLGDVLLMYLLPVTIVIKTVSKGEFAAKVSPARCIVEFKQKLSAKVGVAADDLRIIKNGKEITRGSLYDHSIFDGDVIFLVAANGTSLDLSFCRDTKVTV